jgi:hypothetical protein
MEFRYLLIYNELDMLRYRLSVLNDVVDTFVLVESTRTFRGREHTPLYETVKDTIFAEYKHKIVHIIVDDMPFPDHSTLSTEKGEQWKNEYQYMRGNSNYLIQKGGWHLSYFGDISFIRNKLLNFAHA